MERLPATIHKYSGGSFDPVSRVLVMIGPFFAAWLFYRGAVSTWPDILFPLVLIFGPLFVAFLYTEIDSERIATVFHIGSFCRIQVSSVSWSEVVGAELRTGRTTPNGASTADLILTTKNGKRRRFTTTRLGTGEKVFRAIVNHFHEAAA